MAKKISKKAPASPRNPIVVEMRQLGKRVVKAKKGKGSYSRKGKWA